MTDDGIPDRSGGRLPIPADLVGVVALTVAVNAFAFAPLLRATPLRIPFGLAFVLFVPGYAFVAALFPEAREAGPATDGTSSGSITLLERAVLSFGASIVIVPLLGLVLDATPWGVRLVPMLAATSASTLVFTALAVVRRRRVAEADRFRIPYRPWLAAVRAEVRAVDGTADVVILAVLVAAVVFATGSVAYAVADPAQSDGYSSVTLLTEADDGELVTDGYPDELEAGESGTVVLAIDNSEREPVTYTVVAVEQRLGDDGNGTVREQRELERFEARLEDGERWTQRHAFEPSMTGDDVRIVWLVYLNGDVPDDPSMETAAYSVDLSVEITE